MTPLSKPVSRVTAKHIGSLPVVVTLCPLRGQSEAVLYFRLLGRRTTYPLSLSDAFRVSAELYGQKERQAKREARKHGIPWRQARKRFIAANSMPKFTRQAVEDLA